MKNILVFTFTALLFLSGCSQRIPFLNDKEVNIGTCSVNEHCNNVANTKIVNSLTEVSRISTKCSPCNNFTYSQKLSNGCIYSSDIAFNCCSEKRRLDSSASLKKVYIHKVMDLREDQKVIDFTCINCKTIPYHTSQRLAVIFYKTLEEELTKRGIVVVDKPTAYSIKLDFMLTDFRSHYSQASQHLQSLLQGEMILKTMGKAKKYTITTNQSVRYLRANNVSDLAFYIELLAHQAANKAVIELGKF